MVREERNNKFELK
jgi:hypothetical protein